ncbi:MAG TPA: serine/threonine-protein kinase [Pirellulales bacterium]|nr:serine/threonine-protein kinase [Pirellulales bacterium]
MILPVHFSPKDQTLDAPSHGDTPSRPSSDSPHGCVALVEGSKPELSRETQALLQSRLRAAALVLALGFFLFLIEDTFLVQWNDMRRVGLYIFHAVLTGVLALVGTRLCQRCPATVRLLRPMELVIFGATALFFVAMQSLEVFCWYPEGQRHYIESPTAPWIMLIFIYALFIPNTWRRAAVATSLMALAPIVLYLVAWFSVPAIHEAISVSRLVAIVLMVCLAAVSGSWGVYTIGRLRREAFEARQFGQYRLKKLLGAGGMGEVYLAEHQLLKRPCAIKVIRANKAADPHALARFHAEVRATAKLTHWNTVEIFDYGSTTDGTFYYVMEYLPGLSLSDLVERFGPLPAERVIHLLEQTCDALAEAHSAGLIHRDIKPGNIFAAQRGGIYDVAKLLDFGLVKPIVPLDGANLTVAGTITGSPLYMAPEQAGNDHKPDARSDIYSLGAVAYYLLAGQPPFDSKNAIKVLAAHLHEPVVPPSHHRAEVPADLEAVVMRCLAKDPDHRFSSAGALARALADCEAAGRWTRDMAREWWQNIDHHESRKEAPVAAG